MDPEWRKIYGDPTAGKCAGVLDGIEREFEGLKQTLAVPLGGRS